LFGEKKRHGHQGGEKPIGGGKIGYERGAFRLKGAAGGRLSMEGGYKPGFRKNLKKGLSGREGFQNTLPRHLGGKDFEKSEVRIEGIRQGGTGKGGKLMKEKQEN